jgi:CRP-like cAMP-binding protein
MCYEGDTGTEMFLIIGGRINVMKLGMRPPPGAKGAQLGEFQAAMNAGQLVGLWAVLDDQPRSATLVAQEAADILIIQKEDLRDAIALCPDLAFGLFRVLTRSLRSITASAQGASEHLIATMKDVRNPRNYEKTDGAPQPVPKLPTDSTATGTALSAAAIAASEAKPE